MEKIFSKKALIVSTALMTIFFIGVNFSTVFAQTQTSWPMAGANPQRTSWSQTGDIKGVLKADWVVPIEPYISKKVQVIAAENKVFLSTTKGLYAFDATNGNQLWVYATSMPLEHSPAYLNGVVYVGGLDRKLHAINASNGQSLWTFTAEGGFTTSPLIVNGTVYIGSRDGHMYAVNAQGSANAGQLKWKFKAGGPITTSAAYHQADDLIFFGADDMHAYALKGQQPNPNNIQPVWKSQKFPGLAMNSWWPVVSGNYVYFTVAPGIVGKPMSIQRDAFYLTSSAPADRTPLGTIHNSGNAHISMDVTQKSAGISMTIADYMEDYGNRRSLVILQRSNGVEKTYDFDNDEKKEYAPFLWSGLTGSMTMFPPAVDANGIVYARNGVFADGSIPGGLVSGWQPDSKYVQFVGSRQTGGFGDFPVDEPGAFAGGGNILFHTHCCSRMINSFDVSIPNTNPISQIVSAGSSSPRQWRTDQWKLPGFDAENTKYTFSPNQYFSHADQNPPIPYNGRVYVHRSNALIALSPNGSSQLKTKIASPSQPPKSGRSVATVQNLLATEVQKMVSAGHLRSGVFTVGLQDIHINTVEPDFLDTFHNPSEMYIILLRALPYLPDAQKTQLRSYLQSEWSKYPATKVRHLGFSEGVAREHHVMPENRNGFANKQSGMDLLNYYAAWKYAQEFGGASAIFNEVKPLPALLSDEEFEGKPQKLNEYIAGYKGYLELKKMATGQTDTAVQNTLNSLMAKRAANLTSRPVASTITGTTKNFYYFTPIATNFMYMTPELANYLRANALAKVNSVVAEHESTFPLWFVAKGTEMQGEGATQPPQYYHGLFQAKAGILKLSYNDVESYLDAPAFAVGDLYYIDNLVAAIEAGGNPPPASLPPSSPTPIGVVAQCTQKRAVRNGQARNQIQVGQEFTYELTLSPSNHTGASVSDPIPEGLSVIASSLPSYCSASGSVLGASVVRTSLSNTTILLMLITTVWIGGTVYLVIRYIRLKDTEDIKVGKKKISKKELKQILTIEMGVTILLLVIVVGVIVRDRRAAPEDSSAATGTMVVCNEVPPGTTKISFNVKAVSGSGSVTNRATIVSGGSSSTCEHSMTIIGLSTSVTPSNTVNPTETTIPSSTPTTIPSQTPSVTPTIGTTPGVTPTITIQPTTPVATNTPQPTQGAGVACGRADVNQDGKFTIVDFIAFASMYQRECNDANRNYQGCGHKDSDKNGKVEIHDFISFAGRYAPRESCAL